MLPWLIAGAPLLIFVFVFVRREISRHKIKSAELTPIGTLLNHRSDEPPRDPSRLRLSPAGRLAMFFAVLFGFLWIGITALIVRALILDPAATLTILIPVGFIPIFFLIPALNLRRDYVLQKKGTLTSGLIIGSITAQRDSRYIYYDFATGQGQVMRGRAIENSILPRLISGAFSPVLYLADRPAVNGLKKCLLWREPWEL